MQNTIKILVTVAIILFTSCSKDDEGSEPKAQAYTTLTNSAEVVILFNGNANNSKNKLALDGKQVQTTGYKADRKGANTSAVQFDGNDDFLEYADLNSVLDNKKFI